MKKLLLIAALVGTVLAGCKKDDKNVMVTEITLNKAETTIFFGESELLSVTEVNPGNATERGVTWESDNKARATVDETGMVTALATASMGSVNITATAKDGSGVSATCVVTVADPRSPYAYFGKWVTSPPLSITFSANEIYGESSFYENWYKVSPITWMEVTNTNSATKEDYPSGYKITGLFSEAENLEVERVGDPFGEDRAFFLHKDGNSIIEQLDNNSGYSTYTKDISGVAKVGKQITGALEPAKVRGSGYRQ